MEILISVLLCSLFYLFIPGLFVVHGYRVANSRKLNGWRWLATFGVRAFGFPILFWLVTGIIIGSFLGPVVNAPNYVTAEAACRAFVEAEEIYFRTDYNNDGVHEYAQHLSGPDSLLMNGSTEIALVDRAFAAAEGDLKDPTPKAGYLFRILSAQGKSCRDGALSYLENGRMTKGYAIIAYPAAYGDSGYTSYMTSKSGKTYFADLGANTAQIAKAVTEFDPDPKLWKPQD